MPEPPSPRHAGEAGTTSRTGGPWRVLAATFGAWVHEVTPATLRADALAGLLGALLVLPQGIAFATLAGLPPQYGLASAVVPCIVAALFGSSRLVVSGPTNANSLALYAMLVPLAAVGSPHYIELALALTLLVGLMQALVGALRLGLLAQFISPAALLGFTTGAAVLIAAHALKDALNAGVPAGLDAFGVLRESVARFGAIEPAAALTAATALVVAAVLRRVVPRWPFMLIGLVVAGLVGALLNARAGVPPDPQGSGLGPVPVLGHLPSPWPHWHVPQLPWAELPLLLEKALALAVVALGQSLAIAKVLAQRSGERLDANREFIGQGLSNLAGGLSSCYLSCGSLNRSMPNLEAGARTPLAAVFSAVLVLVLVVGLEAIGAAWLALIPKAAIAGLLMLVAWTLVDGAAWRRLAAWSRPDFIVAAVTALAMLVLRLEAAILLGAGLSLVVHLYRSSQPAMRSMGFASRDAARQFVVIEHTRDALPECPQLKLLRMEGSVWFGATAHVQERLESLRRAPAVQPHLLVMSKSMNDLDLAGAELWAEELRRRRAMGGDLYFHRPRPPVLAQWERTGFLDALGRDHVFPDKRIAIASIFPRLDAAICRRCTARIFEECGPAPAPAAGPVDDPH